MELNDRKAIKILYQNIISKYNTIEVNPGKCRYNFRCQYNAVHEAKKHNHKKIAMCVYMDDGQPIIHFINYNKGKFVDNTLGQWSKCYNYYFIKWIDKEDLWDVHAFFSAFRKDLGRALPWWIRITSEYRG
jgi:hypothetical protein